MGGMGGGAGARGARGGGMFGGMSESTAKLIDANEINVAFKDVAGTVCERVGISVPLPTVCGETGGFFL